ncbi:MAG TPA: ATP-dependent Clp protease ATP-binding subunit [Clostridiales bacterium]|nr:ATP-dependent Clp protease ATP-binding subunit [Clostridiales bacterium]
MLSYTKDVQKALSIAEGIASSYNEKINTDHILYGLASVDGSYAQAILKKLNISPLFIKKQIDSNPSRVITDSISFTNNATNALNYASSMANRFRQKSFDTHHLLLAIATEKNTNASNILKSAGVTYNTIQSLTEEYLKNDSINSDRDDISIEDIFNNFFSDMSFPNIGFSSSGFRRPERPENRFNPRNEANATQKNNSPLDDFGEDLTSLAEKGEIDPVIGREDEIKRVIQIMSRRKKNNPILIGEPGVGKTAIVNGLALAIVNNEVPEMLKNKRIFSLNMSTMVAGTKYRGDFEERLKNAIESLKDGKTLLFIDEIHTIVNAGSSEGGTTAANILKPILTTGAFPIIGATTIDEYRKYIESDPALERRFQTVMINPPSVEDTIEILKGLRKEYEKHHKVAISDEALVAAAKLSDRYIMDRFLPDKAIDIIDEACSKMVNEEFTSPDKLKNLEDKVKNLEKEIENAVLKEEYKNAYDLQVEKKKTTAKLDELKKEWSQKASKKLILSAEDIASIVSEWSGIPVTSLTEEETEKLKRLESDLKKYVIGQDEAIASVANAVKRARSGIKDPNKPIGSFIFLGPTGVGKTELSKALSKTVFGDENFMIRLDMSEYMDKINVSKLIGAAPGYVGYDEGGQLTEQVRRKPYSVVLFDEIEKAHPDVFNILLQILDDGRLTDSKGRVVSFKNTIIIMTSNIGASSLSSTKKVGFGETTQKASFEQLKQKQLEELKKTMKPEFINRIDEIIFFDSLSKESLEKIIDILFENLKNTVKQKNIEISFDNSVKDLILKEGTNEEYGARPLKRAITKYIENPLSDAIINSEVKENTKIIAYVKDNKVKFKTEKK